jgi:hypothetical protein
VSDNPAVSFLRRWRQQVPPKSRSLSISPHGVTCQKTVIFIVTASRTSHFTSTVKPEYEVNVGYIYILGEEKTMGKLAVPMFWPEEN